jgi:vanillate O-demethylase ferredoxin subunit
VARRVRETEDIISLELASLDGSPLPAFTAGAHIDVHVAPGVVRQYSLSNSPAERHRYVLGVLRDPNSRGGSTQIHSRLVEGAVVEISEPRNHFSLHGSEHSVLIAGGIGITPLLSMAAALHDMGSAFALHYCARSEGMAAFRDTIGASAFASMTSFHYDDAGTGQLLNLPEIFSRAPPDTHVYVCGPAGFIAWVCREAEAAGLPPARVHFEYFSGKAVDTSSDGAFDVKLSSTSQVFRIPADRSIASVLIEAGIDLYTACEEGTCGTCVTGVLEGEPDHRDVFLTDAQHAAGDLITPCCSRSRSPLLVLDL